MVKSSTRNASGTGNRISLRFAEEEDVKDLFTWRNDPLTRKYAFDPAPLSWKRHVAWFYSSLSNPSRTILIASDNLHKKIGQIRFDRKGKNAEIDIVISPNHRGKGYGSLLLKKASLLYLHNYPVSALIAKVKDENVASVALFKRCGFRTFKTHKDYIELRFTLPKRPRR